MKLYGRNPSSDSATYLAGDVVLSANSTTEVLPGFWLRLLRDPSFLNDVHLRNIQLSDGLKSISSDEEIESFLALIDKSIEVDTPLVLEGIAAGSAGRGGETSYVYALPGNRILSRIILLVSNSKQGDFLKVELTDPNGNVLQTPSPKCYVVDGRAELPVPFKRILAGLRLKVTYTSTASALEQPAFFALNVLWAYN